MLLNAIRTVMAPRSAQPPAEPLPKPGTGADQPPNAGAPAPSGGGGEEPAWRQLGTRTGVQDQDYGEHGRAGVQALFRQAPRRLLDIGCATGAVGAALKRTIPGLWVWGCEPSEQSARVAAARLDRVSTAPREEWNADDLAQVASIDTVLLLDVLEHMYNPWAELEFLAARLPRDAQVIVSLPNIGHLGVLAQLAQGKFPYELMGILDVTHVRFFTYDGMLEMFEQTGFDVEAATTLSCSPAGTVERYPVTVDLGKMALRVDDEHEWNRLHTIQFGFRLRPRA